MYEQTLNKNFYLPFSIFKNHGILGINARNLEYLRPFNRKKAMQMADSKLATKQFLSTRGIPVPKLIATIRDHNDLAKFDFNALPDSFVLKPNAGFGGEGILVVKNKVSAGIWQKISGDPLTEEKMQSHILDILDGKFSIASIPDIAFFESRVNSTEFIPKLEVEGLPDIRVIVHNLIPVMAMLRIPTPESGGKANVHLGGIGIGIDISSGKTTFATQFNKLIDQLPGEIQTNGHLIPQWDEILLVASKSQLHTNLGYLAADVVIDEKEGPVLLEVNARAGLMVQIANLAPLKKRLERIRGLTVDSPEKGIKLGKELFGKSGKKKSKKVKKTVVSYIEQGEILLGKESYRVTAELDPTHETTAIDAKLAKKLEMEKVSETANTIKLKLLLGGQRITTVAELTNLEDANYKIILGRRDLADFLIDPTSRETRILPKAKPRSSVEKFDFGTLDKKLMAFDRQIKLLYYLKPTNLLLERKKFFTKKNYNPQFRYLKPKFDAADLLSELNKLDCPESPLGRIFHDKKIEISQKIILVSAVGTPDFTDCSRKLYGFPKIETVIAAREILDNKPHHFARENAALDATAASREFEKTFKKYGLKKWKVILREDLISDVIAGKRNTLFVRSGAIFSPERLLGTIAHEVETHILRAENGKTQPYEIFARGLANYLETEEGLAIFNQNLVLKKDSEKKYWPIVNLLAVEFAATHNFCEVFNFVKKYGFDSERAWKTALKTKRGLSDTATPGGFTKEHLYFSGLHKIAKFVDGGGDLQKLFVGKIKVEDIETVAQLSEIRPAKLLPDFYAKKNQEE